MEVTNASIKTNTIATALAKKKILESRLYKLRTLFFKYAAWPQYKKCPIGIGEKKIQSAVTAKDCTAKESLVKASTMMNNEYKSYMDLSKEYSKLIDDINYTSMSTIVTWKGTKYSLANLLTMQRTLGKSKQEAGEDDSPSGNGLYERLYTVISGCEYLVNREVKDKIKMLSKDEDKDNYQVYYLLSTNKKTDLLKKIDELGEELNSLINSYNNIIELKDSSELLK